VNRIADNTGGGGPEQLPNEGAVPIPISHPNLLPSSAQIPVAEQSARKDMRKRKRTKAIERKLLDAISKGHSRRDMAKLAGINFTTFYDWLHGDPLFAREVEKAEAQYAGRLLRVIDKASGLQWQAAAWILERRFPEQWGRHLVTEPPKSEEQKIAALSPEEQIARLRGIFGMTKATQN
jgi:transposase